MIFPFTKQPTKWAKDKKQHSNSNAVGLHPKCSISEISYFIQSNYENRNMPFQVHDKFFHFPNTKYNPRWKSFTVPLFLFCSQVLLYSNNQRNCKLENSSGVNHHREVHNMLPENFFKEISLALYSTYGFLLLYFYQHIFQIKKNLKITIRLSPCLSLLIYSQKKSATITL